MGSGQPDVPGRDRPVPPRLGRRGVRSPFPERRRQAEGVRVRLALLASGIGGRPVALVVVVVVEGKGESDVVAGEGGGVRPAVVPEERRSQGYDDVQRHRVHAPLRRGDRGAPGGGRPPRTTTGTGGTTMLHDGGGDIHDRRRSGGGMPGGAGLSREGGEFVFGVVVPPVVVPVPCAVRLRRRVVGLISAR